MAEWTFDGVYQTNVQMPDGSVVLCDPGEVYELTFEPGPLFTPAQKAKKPAPKVEPGAEVPTVTLPVEPVAPVEPAPQPPPVA